MNLGELHLHHWRFVKLLYPRLRTNLHTPRVFCVVLFSVVSWYLKDLMKCSMIPLGKKLQMLHEDAISTWKLFHCVSSNSSLSFLDDICLILTLPSLFSFCIHPPLLSPHLPNLSSS